GDAYAAGLVMAVVFRGDVVVRDIVDVGKGAPDLAGNLRVKGQLITGIPPGGPRVFIPPDPGAAGVARACQADIGIGDVVTVGLEGVDVIMPRRRDDKPVAGPGRTRRRRLTGGGIGMSAKPRLAAVLCDVWLVADQDQPVRVAAANGHTKRCLTAL